MPEDPSQIVEMMFNKKFLAAIAKPEFKELMNEGSIGQPITQKMLDDLDAHGRNALHRARVKSFRDLRRKGYKALLDLPYVGKATVHKILAWYYRFTNCELPEHPETPITEEEI